MKKLTEKQELQLRSDVIAATCDLLNDFGAYLHAEDNSSQEDQFQATMDARVNKLMSGGREGLGGHVILCLAAMLHNCGDPEQVQEWLNDQGEHILMEAVRISAED
jgi:hypothetical protein